MKAKGDVKVREQSWLCAIVVDTFFDDYGKEGDIIDLGAISHCIIPETLGRYSCQKDDKGTRMFEGDIVLSGNKRLWLLCYGCYTRKDIGGLVRTVGWYLKSMSGIQGVCEFITSGSYIVVGNKIDNPEWIKGQSKDSYESQFIHEFLEED